MQSEKEPISILRDFPIKDFDPLIAVYINGRGELKTEYFAVGEVDKKVKIIKDLLIDLPWAFKQLEKEKTNE